MKKFALLSGLLSLGALSANAAAVQTDKAAPFAVVGKEVPAKQPSGGRRGRFGEFHLNVQIPGPEGTAEGREVL